ncbi:MAG TPA: copper-binding protein [Blastocatellia bacterium]|nr:copper-binding protein [Blastocatellia bacterium]
MKVNRSTSSSAPRLMMLAIAIFAISFAACRRASGNEQRYDLKGVVVSVDKRGSTVTIAHEAIPNYMDAMTMPFKLKDEWAFDKMAPGNRVQATLVVDGLRSWLENIVIMQVAVDESSASAARSSVGPKPGEEVPDFTLVNQDGRRVRLRSYKGRALVLTFIYTRCPLPDYCPLMTDNFAEIIKAIKNDAALYAKTQLLSVSVDPEYDTPERLREYGAGRTTESGAQTFSRWQFATGSADEVKRIATYFGLQYFTEADQIIHSLVTAVISPDGKVAKLYTGNEWKPAEIISDLQNFKQQEQATSKEKPQDKPSEKPQAKIYRAVGVVDSINEQRTTVQIDHEDIKDLMPAMKMPFEVKDKSLLDQIAPGDRVAFTIQDLPYGLVVIEIKKR